MEDTIVFYDRISVAVKEVTQVLSILASILPQVDDDTDTTSYRIEIGKALNTSCQAYSTVSAELLYCRNQHIHVRDFAFR